MKNREYWSKRFEQLQESLLMPADEYIKELENAYRLAQREIEKEIAVWYQRFADNNGIADMAEARRLLNSDELEELKWDVYEYIKYGRENAVNQKWVKELENASARVHINSLEALKLQTRQAIEKLYSGIEKDTTKLTKDIYSESYYKTAYEMAKGSGVGQSISQLNENMLDKTIRKLWAVDGKNFSERIWGYKETAVNTIYQEINKGLISGKTVDEMSKSLAKAVGVKESNAKRLVLTESAYFSSLGSKESFEKLGVERFEVLGTLDSITCGECGEFDGKVYAMKDYEIAVTAPPFHCNCRCTTAPYFDDEFTEGEKRTARNEEGKTVRVDNMSYEEWKERFVEEEVEKDIDYMSNSFRPKFGKETVNTVGNIKIQIKKVDNSNFELYTDIENTDRNKAVRLTEKNLRKVVEQMPNGFEMPKVVVIDFDKYGINGSAIGGYMKETQTMYINSKYDTSEKIKDYINKTKGYFSNSTELAPYLHELGHKRYEDRLIEYAKENDISVDKARNIVENRLMEYVGRYRNEDEKVILNKISEYAYKSYNRHNYSEIFAESLSCDNINNFIIGIIGIIRLKR